MKKKNKENNYGFSDNNWAIVSGYIKEFDTPEKRSQDLLRKINFKGCSYCGTSEVRRNKDGRSAYCSKCRMNSQITAGTFFHGISRLDIVHPQIYFYEAGVKFSANQIRVLFECAYGTAWRSNNKIKKVVFDAMKEGCTSTIHSSLFEPVYSKRSVETPARHHPRYEQVVCEDEHASSNSAQDQQNRNEQEQPENTDTESTAPFYASTNAHNSDGANKTYEILDFLGEAPISFDNLLDVANLTAGNACMQLLELEFQGLIEKLPGDNYTRKRDPKREFAKSDLAISTIQIFEQPDQGLKSSIEKIIGFIKETFHGISRKYLQLFLAANWLYQDRSRWNKGSVFQACLAHDRVTEKELKEFNSKISVLFFKPQKSLV